MSSRILQPDDPRVAPLVFRAIPIAEEAKDRHAAMPDPTPPTESAEQHAARLALLERQCEVRVRDAHAAGVREGEAAGRARAMSEIQPVLERLSATIQEIGGFRARLRREAESDMVKLSLAIARRVLRRELAVDPEALHGLVLAALEKLQAQEINRVRVHPSHAAAVTGYLRKEIGGVPTEVLPDPSRELGTVIFETQRGNLDASVESQFQEIERGLADRLRRHS